jgi:DNA-binding NarL/FixJ family response regulator
MVEISLAVGDLEGSRAACRELSEIAEVLGTQVLAAMAGHARGAVCLAEGDAHAALQPLRHALRVWHDFGAPYLMARIRVLLARAYRQLGDADAAALEFRLARETFDRLGARPELACLDALGSRPEVVRGHGLTARELQVLRLLATGKTNKAIAGELSLSEKTIDRHVSNIFGKLDVPSRAAATAYAYEHRLV